MIAGVGTDIIRVERIKRLLLNYPHFVDKVFTAGEIEYCSGKASPEQSYAVRFSAKEAVMKALGTGWNGMVNWKDIEVVYDEQGKPEILAYNGTRELLDQLEVSAIHVSLSHEKEYAVAFVVLERQKT